jgi:superfamily II DNA or RNA helicase
MTADLEIGSLVEVRGQKWLLTRAEQFDRCTLLWLEGRERSNAMERIRVLSPFDRPRPVSSQSLHRRKRTVVLDQALAAIQSCNPPNALWTAANARIDLLAYQLEPAMAALGGATRLLLADAVGLGKTIQAGLLLAELHQRGWIDRALIVCPAGLRETWRDELRDRFGLNAAIFDQQSIADRAAFLPRGLNPWLTANIAIASIDFVKRPEVLAALDRVPVDLLIADEAHHLSPGTDRGAAVAAVAARAVWCVLLSATPHSGDRAAFDYLIEIGGHADRIAIFRRTRRDVGVQHSRRTHFLAVSATETERVLLSEIDRYSRAIWNARGRLDHAARLVAITIARRASSSIAAIQRTLRRRLDLLGTNPPAAEQPLLPWHDEDAADGEAGDEVLSTHGLDNLDDERSALRRLIDLTARCDGGSKIRRLRRILSRANEPAIVFSEYRDTLAAIVDALSPFRQVTSIHGGMALDERRCNVDAFNAGAFDLLVATDAAGEGLSLHRRCRLVIDFELPWNPLRLEQRIGRVDRLGQRKTIHAIRMLHAGTIEEDVLERLSLRQRRADSDLARAVADMDVASAIFDRSAAIIDSIPAIATATVAGSQAEASRVRAQRRRIGHRDERRCWVMPGNGRPMLMLHRVRLANEYGVITGDTFQSHRVTWRRRPQSPREWRRAIDGVSEAVGDVAGQRHQDRDRIRARINAIRKHLARQRRREYQRSLFDGRAEVEQVEREQSASRVNRALDRIERATAPADPRCSRVALIAAWPERRT